MSEREPMPPRSKWTPSTATSVANRRRRLESSKTAASSPIQTSPLAGEPTDGKKLDRLELGTRTLFASSH